MQAERKERKGKISIFGNMNQNELLVQSFQYPKSKKFLLFCTANYYHITNLNNVIEFVNILDLLNKNYI